MKVGRKVKEVIKKEEKIDVLLSKEKENQNLNLRTYHFLNSVSQFTRQEVGTTIRCGPHIPLYAAKYPIRYFFVAIPMENFIMINKIIQSHLKKIQNLFFFPTVCCIFFVYSCSYQLILFKL